MRNALLGAALLLCLQGCGQDTAPGQPVHTEFSQSTGLTVSDADGTSQQLIADSLDARAVVSPSSQWIAVEDMRMSNLVVVRLFHRQGGHYQEVALPELRTHWEQLAQQAGIAFEDLVAPRIAIESFDENESHLLLRFQAQAEPQGTADLVSVLAIPLARSDGQHDPDLRAD